MWYYHRPMCSKSNWFSRKINSETLIRLLAKKRSDQSLNVSILAADLKELLQHSSQCSRIKDGVWSWTALFCSKVYSRLNIFRLYIVYLIVYVIYFVQTFYLKVVPIDSFLFGALLGITVIILTVGEVILLLFYTLLLLGKSDQNLHYFAHALLGKYLWEIPECEQTSK